MGSRVAAKQRDMEKRVTTVGVLASQRNPDSKTAESDQKLLVLLESLPKKISDFKDSVNHRIEDINEYLEQADQLNDNLELFSDWLAKFDDVKFVPNEQLEEIVNQNEMLDQIYTQLNNYDKSIKVRCCKSFSLIILRAVELTSIFYFPFFGVVFY